MALVGRVSLSLGRAGVLKPMGANLCGHMLARRGECALEFGRKSNLSRKVVAARHYWWSSRKAPTPSTSESSIEDLTTTTTTTDELVENTASSSQTLPTPTPTDNIDISSLSESLQPPVDSSLAETLLDLHLPALAMSTIPESAFGSWFSLITPLQYLFIHTSQFLPAVPGWGVIVVGTIAIRLASIPFAIRQTRTQAIMQRIMPELKVYQDEVQAAKDSGNRVKLQTAAMKLRSLYQRENINPLGMVGNTLGSMVPSVACFFAVRRFLHADPAIPGIVNGGFGWLTDLTVADPYYVLPLIGMAALQWQFSVMSKDITVMDSNSWQAHLPNLMRGFTLISLPLFMTFPAGLFFYFIPTGLLLLLQIQVLRSNLFRKWLNIPLVPKKQLNTSPSIRETIDKVKRHFSDSTGGGITKGW